MKAIRNVIAIAVCVAFTGSAHAQFGGLSNLMGGNKPGATGAPADVASAVSTFVTKSAVLGALTGEAVLAINSAFASESERAAKFAKLNSLKKITDPKEKAAQFAELNATEAAEAQRRYDSGEMEKAMAGLSADKKKQIGDALLNFGIGGLQALELTRSGQSLLQAVASNPMDIMKLAPVKQVLPMLGKIANDSGSLMGGIIKLARGANISVQVPKAESKPATISMS